MPPAAAQKLPHLLRAPLTRPKSASANNGHSEVHREEEWLPSGIYDGNPWHGIKRLNREVVSEEVQESRLEQTPGDAGTTHPSGSLSTGRPARLPGPSAPTEWPPGRPLRPRRRPSTLTTRCDRCQTARPRRALWDDEREAGCQRGRREQCHGLAGERLKRDRAQPTRRAVVSSVGTAADPQPTTPTAWRPRTTTCSESFQSIRLVPETANAMEPSAGCRRRKPASRETATCRPQQSGNGRATQRLKPRTSLPSRRMARTGSKNI